MQNLFCHCAAPVTGSLGRSKVLLLRNVFHREAVENRTKYRSTYFLTMPRTSSSRMIRNSSPSSLISVPEYLPKRTLSPAFTSRGKTLPYILTGGSGQFSLGQGAFYAVGAYTSAILMEHADINYVLTLPI